jgi:hypothetical protein
MPLGRYRKKHGTEIEWDTSASGVYWWCEYNEIERIYYKLKKKQKLQIDARKEIGLQINVEKNENMFLPRRQNSGQRRAKNIRQQEHVIVQILGNYSNKWKFV